MHLQRLPLQGLEVSPAQQPKSLFWLIDWSFLFLFQAQPLYVLSHHYTNLGGSFSFASLWFWNKNKNCMTKIFSTEFSSSFQLLIFECKIPVSLSWPGWEAEGLLLDRLLTSPSALSRNLPVPSSNLSLSHLLLLGDSWENNLVNIKSSRAKFQHLLFGPSYPLTEFHPCAPLCVDSPCW